MDKAQGLLDEERNAVTNLEEERDALQATLEKAQADLAKAKNEITELAADVTKKDKGIQTKDETIANLQACMGQP